MATLSVQTVLEVAAALTALGEEKIKKGSLSLQIARARRAFYLEAREYEERRAAEEEQYAELDPETGRPTGNILDVYAYRRRLRDLQNTRITVLFDPIPWSEFGDAFPWKPNVLDPLVFAGVIVGVPDTPGSAKTSERSEPTH